MKNEKLVRSISFSKIWGSSDKARYMLLWSEYKECKIYNILFFGQKIQSSIGPQVSVQEFASKVSFS